jgi:tetratricopeptide (TPR) repeat protein
MDGGGVQNVDAVIGTQTNIDNRKTITELNAGNVRIDGAQIERLILAGRQAGKVLRSPPAPGDWFWGRSKDLDRLRTHVVARSETVAAPLNGLAGIGKTSLASAYVAMFLDEYERVVWFENCDDLVALDAQFVQVARELGYGELPAGEAVQAVRASLAGTARWLVVFDNAAPRTGVGPDSLRSRIPTGGHVIVTTRDGGWSPNREDMFEVDPLSMVDVVDWLVHALKVDDRTVLERIAGELDGLPLAITQAISYLNESGAPRLLVEQYALDLAVRKSEMLSEGHAADYPYTVKAVMDRSLLELGVHEPGARLVLGVLSMLAPVPIPIEWVSKVTGDGNLRQVIGALRRFGLVSVRDETVSVHRIVQDLARELLAVHEQHATCDQLLAMFTQVLPDPSEPDSLSWWRAALPHARIVEHRARVIGLLSAHMVTVQAQLGMYLFQQAQYKPAVDLYERAIATKEVMLGPEHPEVAKTLGNLGVAYHRLGEHIRAIELHERAAAIFEATLGTDHPQVAMVLDNLATAYRGLGEENKAVELHKRAVVILEASLGPDHPEVAMALGNLGNAYSGLGEHKRAAELHERAVVILEASLGPDHPEVAMALGNLGIDCRTLGETNRAIELYERAAAIFEANFGTDHPMVAMTLCNLGVACQSLGEHSRAIELYERAAAIFEATLGTDHPHSLTARGLARS